MTLHARCLDLPADPLAIARSLADEPGFAFLWAADGSGPSYVACHPVDRATTLDPEPALRLSPGAGPLASVPRWIGLLPYEARRDLERPAWTRTPDERAPPHLSLPLWARFGAVVRVHEDVLVVGDDAGRVAELVRRLRTPGRSAGVRAELAASEIDALHAARIRRALELIVQGQIYQVNLARRFDFLVEGRAVDLVERLVRQARGPHAVAVEVDGLTVAGSSPELCLALDARGRLLTAPIKGTRPRGRDAPTDAALAGELEMDPKERAELSMVIDVERNDLGRVARTGTVRVRRGAHVRAFGSVHHRLAEVAALLRPEVDRSLLLSAMLPSGSVTGAPKIRAMEVIATLEAERRGLYTGAFGALAHDGALRMAMAIRTLTRRAGVAHYFAGGGIVFGSDPEKEVLETRWKAVQMHRLLDAFPGDTPPRPPP
jgi:anthranilate/para-aminobenzoate synthase component I